MLNEHYTGKKQETHSLAVDLFKLVIQFIVIQFTESCLEGIDSFKRTVLMF